MPGGAVNGGGAAGNGRIDNLVSQLMAYRANAPIIDQLLQEAGFGRDHPIGALLNGLKAPEAEHAALPRPENPA